MFLPYSTRFPAPHVVKHISLAVYFWYLQMHAGNEGGFA